LRWQTGEIPMTKQTNPTAGHNSGASLIVLAQNYFSSDKKADNAVIAARKKRALLFDTLEADGVAVDFHLKHENADGNKEYSDIAKDIRAAWIAARYGKDGSTLWAAYEDDPTSLTNVAKFDIVAAIAALDNVIDLVGTEIDYEIE
jgi:hypothetical protein